MIAAANITQPRPPHSEESVFGFFLTVGAKLLSHLSLLSFVGNENSLPK